MHKFGWGHSTVRKYGPHLTQVITSHHKSSQVISAFLAGTPFRSGLVGLPFLLRRRFSACLHKLGLVRRNSGGMNKFIANGIHSSPFSCVHLRSFLGVGTLLAIHLQKAELEHSPVIGGDVPWSGPSHFLQGISCAGCRVINLSSCQRQRIQAGKTCSCPTKPRARGRGCIWM